MARLVKFNRGAGEEYGLAAGANEDGSEIIVPLNVPVTETVNSKLSSDASPSGGQFVYVK